MQLEQKQIGTRNRVRLNKTEVKQLALLRCPGAALFGVNSESNTRTFSVMLSPIPRGVQRPEKRVELARAELVGVVCEAVRAQFSSLPETEVGITVKIGLSMDGSVSGVTVVWYDGEGETDEGD